MEQVVLVVQVDLVQGLTLELEQLIEGVVVEVLLLLMYQVVLLVLEVKELL